jgi:hypothetical protein
MNCISIFHNMDNKLLRTHVGSIMT